MRRALFAACIAVSLVVVTADAAAQESAAEALAGEIRIEEDLRYAEELLSSGTEVSEEDVARLAALEESARADSSRSIRVRSAVVAFLARELHRSQVEQDLGRAAARAVAEADRATRRAIAAHRSRVAGFWISLGVTVASSALFGVAQYLGEAAFVRYAGSATPAEAAEARRETEIYAALAIAGAAAWGAGLGATILFALLGGATSPP